MSTTKTAATAATTAATTAVTITRTVTIGGCLAGDLLCCLLFISAHQAKIVGNLQSGIGICGFFNCFPWTDTLGSNGMALITHPIFASDDTEDPPQDTPQ